MLLAERTISTDCGGAFTTNWFSYAHGSRLLEYENTGSGWTLTPGHVPLVCNSNFNLKFTTGAATSIYDNSAGGVDYGYASFDPSTTAQPDCDRFVWNTGDGLHPNTGYNTYCSQPGNTWLYGMQGFPATGGSNLNSLLIDFDNDVCTYDKILIGDVEIFKCGCKENPTDFPCDSLWVTKKPQDPDPTTPPDTCCWDVDFHIHGGPVASLEVASLTPGVIFNNPSLSSQFQWGGTPTGTLLPIVWGSPGHGIPQGDYSQALKFCLGNILTPQQDTQCVVFRWFVLGPTDEPYLACTDTCYFYCPPPVFGDTCLLVKNDSVVCNPDSPNEHCYFFQVQNLGNFTASQVVLSNPTPGFQFKPCPPPNIFITSPTIALPNPALSPGVAPDSCFPQMCVKLVATTPITAPTTVCFDVGLSSNDSCCHSPKQHCVLLEPCCDPCEENGVVSHVTNPDSCCHSLDIVNDCNLQFFTKLQLELLTPGVIFGSHYTGGPMPGDWINPISTSTLVQWQHVSGYVPTGTIPGLINFCLDGIDQPSEVPQIVVLKWLTINANGEDSIACTDTLVFDCPQQNHGCIEALADSIVCKKDPAGNTYYEYTLTFKNASTPPHFATELIFTQIAGPPVTVFPNPVNFYPPGANWCDTTAITTNFFPSGTVNPGDKLTFLVRLHDALHPDNWCCFEGDTLCVFIPPCEPCCQDFEAFCQKVENAVNITVDNPNCKVKFTLDSLPDCNYIEYVNWGDGQQSNGPFSGPGMGMHTYSGSGTYVISWLAIETNAAGLICFEKILHDTITLLCPQQCECGDWALNYTKDGATFPVTCGSQLGFGCPKSGIQFTGTFNCLGPVPGCEPSSVSWTLISPGGTSTGTTSAGAINIAFPTGMVGTPGNYQLLLQSACPGAADSCKCVINWIQEPCPDCICAPPQLTLSAGGVNYPAGCNQPPSNWPTLGCPAADVTVSGTFGCQPSGPGIICLDPQYFWTLSGPSGLPIASGSGVTSGISLTFPAVLVSAPGVYSLTLSTLCPGAIDSCECELNWIQPDCPPACTCGVFEKLKITNKKTGFSQALACNNQPPIALPCPPSGSPHKITGKLACNGNCSGSAITWSVMNPAGTTVLSGNSPGPWFSIAIPNSAVTVNGLYMVKVQGLCNGDTCECKINLLFDGCVPDCKCEPLAAFQAEVNNGFYFTTAGGCAKNIFPKGALTACDQVTWTVKNQSGTVIGSGTTASVSAFLFNFPASGIYQVCMKVKRTQSDGTMCMHEICRPVEITCGPPVLACENPVLQNPGFDQGAVAGVLGQGGASAGWARQAGTPEVQTSEECVDPVAIQLKGNCIILDIIDHTLPLEAGKTYNWRFCYNQSDAPGGGLPQSGTLTGRISTEPQVTSACTGACEEVFRVSLASTATGWLEAQGQFTSGQITGGAVLFTLHLENDFTEDDPATQSAVLIDNICIEKDTATAAGEVPQTGNIRLFPNPTTGGLTLEFLGNPPHAGMLQIVDLRGQILQSKALPKGNRLFEFSIADLPAGVYFVKVMDEGVQVWVKMVIRE